MSTAELFAEVRAIDAAKPHPKPDPPETNRLSDQAKALYSNLNAQRGGSNRGNYRGGGNRGGNHGGSRGGKGNSRGHGKQKGKKSSDFDPNKFCTVHNRQGHDAKHCRKAASERELEEDGGNDSK